MNPIPTANAMKPAPGKGVASFPTPVIKDTVIVEIVNAWKGDYTPLEYGTKWDDVPHASVQGSFPDHKLINQAPNSDDGQWVKRIWANDRVDQDTYNYAIKYSGGSDAHPIYIRTYVELRETYTPVADLTPDPLFPNALLVEEEVQRQDNELDSRYVKVIRTYETLPGPVISTKRYNERGDLETVDSQQVHPSTLPNPDGLLVTQSQVIKEDVSKGTKITATVPSHSQLIGRETKSGLLGRTFYSDNIVTPNTQPDGLTFTGSGGVVESAVTPISATKSKKVTVTSTGPVSLSSDSLVDSPLGLVKAEVSKSIVNPTTQPISNSSQGLLTIRDTIDRLDNVKSQRELVKVEGEWPTNTGVDYDEELGLGIYYTETIVSPSEYTNPNYFGDISNTDYKPIDQWKSLERKIDKERIAQGLLSQWYKISTDVDVTLPDKLLDVTVYWGKSYGQGSNWTTGQDVKQGSYSTSQSGYSKNSASVNGDIYFNIEQGFRGAIPGHKHIFFMEIGDDGRVEQNDILKTLNNFEQFGQQTVPAIQQPSPVSFQIASVERSGASTIFTSSPHQLSGTKFVTISCNTDPSFNGTFNVLAISPTAIQYVQIGKTPVPLTAATGSISYQPIEESLIEIIPRYKRWPYLQTRTENLVVITGGKSETFNTSVSSFASINGFGKDVGCGSAIDVDVSARSINIPQTLHGKIEISEQSIGEFPGLIPPPDGECNFTGSNIIPSFGVRPQILNPTKVRINGEEQTAETFPTGEYLYSSNVELYKWGFVKVTAITVNVTSDYV